MYYLDIVQAKKTVEDVPGMLKRINWLRITIVLVVALTALPAYADGPVTGRNGRAEVRYLEGMIDHHQMAVDMAEHCLANATTEPVRTVCQNVIAAQTVEIETMRGWLKDWYGVEYA